MERINIYNRKKPDQKMEEETYIDFKETPKSQYEHRDTDELREAWGKSVFSNGVIFETIRDAIDIFDDKNDYPQKEVEKAVKILEKSNWDSNLNLINEVLIDEDLGEIHESIFENVMLLMRLAEMIEDDEMSNSLGHLSIKNTEPTLKALRAGGKPEKYARLFLWATLESRVHEKKIIPALKEYIEKTVNAGTLDSKDINIMISLISFGEESMDKYGRHLRSYLENNPNNYDIICGCINSELTSFKNIGKEHISKLIAEYGLADQTETIITKWIAGGGQRVFMPEAFLMNVEMIRSIEKQRPGICQLLISEFGIYDFGRYTEELLIKQHDEIENKDLPYGIAIFAEDDHNGAYFEDGYELEEMAKGLEGKYLFRIIESDGRENLLRSLTKLRLKYGENHKISFAIIAGHGNGQSVTLGRVGKYDREMSVRNILKYGGRKYKLLEDGSTVVLIVCQSGKKNGIGSTISDVLGTTVIAPADNSGLDYMKPKFGNNGKLSFNVRYSHKVRASRFKPDKETSIF